MLRRLAGFLLLVLAAGPGFAQGQGQAPRPQPTQGQAQAQPPQVTIRNDGELTLRELYIARAGQGARGWGPDRFGDRVVSAGERFTLRLPQGFGCVVDIRLVFEDDEEEVRERVDVCRTREQVFARAAPVAPADRELAVENRSPRTIRTLFISGVEESDWGEDRLGADTIAPGAGLIVRYPDLGCLYDLRVVFDNDAAEERRRVDLCALERLVVAPGWTTADDLAAAPAALAAPAAPGRGGEIAIVNRSGRVVFELFAFPDGAAERGRDRLGLDTLADGATLRIPAFRPPGCQGTIALTYNDGAREERAGIDLCATTELVIAPGWTGADPVSPRAAAASPGTVGIVNRSGRTVFQIYTHPDGAQSQGPDRLGADILRPGGSVRVPSARPPACATTLRIVYDSGEPEVRQGLDFCTLAEVVIEAGGVVARPPRFGAVVNAGTTPIVALHADAPGAPRGPDRLGDAVIGVGQSFTLVPPDPAGCTYDLTAMFRDRRTARVTGADLCAGAEIRIAP